MKKVSPLFPDDDYERHYPFDFKGKSILDFGADYGSTAYYFLQKGAKRVVAVEGDIKLFHQLLQNVGDDNRVTCHYCLIEKPEDFEHFLKEEDVDVVKVDLEGVEVFLLNVNPTLITKHPTWIIECHNRVFIKKLTEKFTSLGYKLKTSIPVMPIDSPLYCDIKVLLFERVN